MSQDHAALIDRFYTAFACRDHAAMGACYHDDARFTDPVFLTLDAASARAMWHMLCERGKDLTLTHSDVQTQGDQGSARWVAKYTFQATGRPVTNDIRASFRFAEGKIIEHTDAFDLWRWTRQALGPVGVVLGWTPLLQGQVRQRAQKELDRFMARSVRADQASLK
jgi:ketosteroid isomerase-like protein